MQKNSLNNKTLCFLQVIRNKIFLIRGHKVMLDEDLARMYGVLTRRLNEQVKRNIKRFPDEDFMFQLTSEEFDNLKSQFATSSWGGRRKLPVAFTEQGVAMLSSVLSSDRAIEVNIQIIKVFIRLKEFMLSHKDLSIKIEQLEGKIGRHDQEIRAIFEAIRRLMSPGSNDDYKRTKIGFIVDP